NGLGRKFWRGDIEKHVGSRALELDHLTVDDRIRHLIGCDLDDLGSVLSQALLEPAQVVVAIVIVLHEHCDLWLFHVAEYVIGIDLGLGGIVGLPAHGPRILAGVTPARRTGSNEQLRHPLPVQILLDCYVGRRAEGLKDQKDLVLLYQLADHLNRFGGTIAIVVGDEGDLPAIDSAVVVDHREECRDGPANYPVGGRIARVGVGVTDLDLSIRGPLVISLLRRRGRDGDQQTKYVCKCEEKPARDTKQHDNLPVTTHDPTASHTVRVLTAFVVSAQPELYSQPSTIAIRAA